MRPLLYRSSIAVLTVCFTAATALAHPGHGADGGSHEITHYATEPEHVGPMVLAAVIAVASAAGIAAYLKRRA